MRIVIASTVLLLLAAASVAIAQQPDSNKAPDGSVSPSKAPADKGHDDKGAEGKGTDDKVKTMSGISILGNKEAPKSLVIVPWKSSEIGSGIGVSSALATRIHPVDKDVFMRELHYYDLRSKSDK